MGTPLTVVKETGCTGEFFFVILILAFTWNLTGIQILPLAIVKSSVAATRS